MTARVIGFLISIVAFATPLFAERAHAEPRTRTVDCSAIVEKFKACPTYAVGTVKLVRQFSHIRCVRDTTWGATGDGSEIWVKDGCRGRFVLERGRPFAKPLADPVSCTSKDGAYQHCATPTWGHLITVQKQLGKTPCTHGENWGFDLKGIWVNGDCSAEFAVQ